MLSLVLLPLSGNESQAILLSAAMACESIGQADCPNFLFIHPVRNIGTSSFSFFSILPFLLRVFRLIKSDFLYNQTQVIRSWISRLQCLIPLSFIAFILLF